ncbi:AAA family ATPase [Ectothiorhodospira haloalkaliphila]|uniref:AAA family ATPase n=1 Tax=Ectothiorhodospira haloalkaliphila TaxID=421628 RepID=UPI001EE943E6|nr:AAA family ATPase [Ectothiorhodospira haloalkaliphila]MCG5523511.1 AAA family ATPase [Ectothiorhodospira haloalkaliphila]
MSIDYWSRIFPMQRRLDCGFYAKGQPLLIECMGFPGAGKTTIAKVAVTQFRARHDWSTFFYAKDGKLQHGVRDAGRAIGVVYKSLAGVVSRGQPREMRRMIGVLDRILVFRRARERLSEQDVVIYDQGLIQKLYLMREEDKPERAALESVLEVIKPDLSEVHVFVDTPPELAAERYFVRAKTSSRRPYTQWDRDQITRLYQDQYAVMKWIIEWLKRQSGTRVITLDGRSPVEENADLLVHELHELCKESSRHIGQRADASVMKNR